MPRKSKDLRFEAESELTNFAKAVRSHLSKLNWRYEDLAYNAALSESQVSAWIGRADRIVGKEDVARIAWAIAGGLDKALTAKGAIYNQISKNRLGERNDDHGRGRTHVIMAELLRAAGYRGIEGQAENLTWEELTGLSTSAPTEDPAEQRKDSPSGEPMLRFGFTSSELIRLVDGEASGLVAEICHHLARYIGVKEDFEACHWTEVGRKLFDRRIDVVAPMVIHYPRHMFDMRFTRSLPGLRCGLNCLINKSIVNEISKTGREPKSIADIDFAKLTIKYTQGNIGSLAVKLFVPPGQRHWAEEVKGDETPEWNSVIEKPRDVANQRYYCYLTGQLICHQAISKYDNTSTLLPLKNSPSPFPYSFGVSHTEPRLHNIIDKTIEFMYENEDLMISIYKDHVEMLQAAAILPNPKDNPMCPDYISESWLKELLGYQIGDQGRRALR